MSRPAHAVRWALAGAVLGAAVALVLAAPARWAAAALERASGGHLRLDDARGTLWSGSAHLTLTGGAGSRDAMRLPTRVHWTLRPAGWADWRLAIDSRCCTSGPWGLTGQWRPGAMRVQVDDGVTEWPAAWLAGLGTPWNTLEPEGRLRLAPQGLSLEWAEGRLRLSGLARLDVQDLSSRLSTLRPLGSYRIAVSGAGGASVKLDTLEGSLRMSGEGQWIGPRLRFRGEASAEPGREAALSNLLNILGRRQGDRSLISIG